MCPFLRLETDAGLLGPTDAPGDDHRCVAIDGPRVISHQQQELVCLRSAHVDCPRYRRAVAEPASTAHVGRNSPRLSRAVAASLVVLALSAGISFGFVVQRGGIDLPSSPRPSGAAVVAASRPAATSTITTAASASAATTPAAPPATTGPTPSITAPPTDQPTTEPSPSTEPSASASPTVAPSASGGPSTSRLAVLKPCPGQKGCYVYTIRAGDNVFSIAHWFGVPQDTVYRWNPTLRKTGIHPGMQIKIPTPTR